MGVLPVKSKGNDGNRKPEGHQQIDNTRRNLVHTAWLTPVIVSVTLPAHGQTSEFDDVRAHLSPCGWGQISWEALNSNEQQLWELIGLNQNTWNAGIPHVANSVSWAQLSGAQKRALTILGFNHLDWDYVGEICGF